jgi:drug/metabolite transporter (DMT)-like permease
MNIQSCALSTSKSIIWLPLLFILMWSSGYIAGKIGIAHTGPFTLIFIRFSSAAFILFLIAILTKAPWPSSWQKIGHIAMVGVLIQVLQFGGVYSGLNQGVSAGISALIVGSMPIFVALGSGWVLSEKISSKQWQGLFIGLIGVALVISNKVSLDNAASLAGYFYVFLALIGITAGTLYQKRFCADMDLRTGGVIQLGIAAVFTYILAWQNEALVVDWSAQLVFSVAWLSLVNSIAAISILYVLIRQGEASRVASLFYLIPPTTAIMGWLILGEQLSTMVILGFMVASIGVYLSTKK